MDSGSNISAFPEFQIDPRLASRNQTKNFLVVDDDTVHRMVIGKVGEKAGYALTTAASIDEAARKLEARKFDCISLDLSLGGENGAQVLTSIAKHNPHALVIVISGAAAAIREEALKLAAALKLNAVEAPKPVDLVTLRTRLLELAAQAQA